MLQAINLHRWVPLIQPLKFSAAASVDPAAGIGAGFKMGRSCSASTLTPNRCQRWTTSAAHVVDVPAFRIGTVPVTNAEWRQFIADGGYRQPRWWSAQGWEHQQTGKPMTAPAVLER